MQIGNALFILIASICSTNSVRILGVFPFPAYSHYQLGDSLLKELAARGHEITVISPYREKTPVKNFKQIILTGINDAIEEMTSDLFEQVNYNVIQKIVWTDTLGLNWTEKTLSHSNVQEFLKSDEKFDLVILHQLRSEAYKGFCHHFNAPCVVFMPMPVPQWTNSQMGNPFSPSYVIEYLVKFSGHMNFFERFYNTFVSVATQLYFYSYTFHKQNELLQKHFPGAPHLHDLYYNTSLMLINSHVSVTAPLPYVPNMIEIAGIHINQQKELPRELKEYLDDAKNGAIYFSMGSNLKAKNLPNEKRDAMLKTFAKLKQKVLWKWDGEELPNQPSNVKISKRLPQQDILAHPNLKLFITHGGLLSTTEAVYHGVPLVGIPVFSDQLRNMASVQTDGYGIAIPYKQLTEETLTRAINAILTNPKYSENAKLRSAVMHDQPMKPLDRAVFWIEYVLRHKGAPHLRTAALNLTWYRYLLLDVAAVVVLVASVLLFVIIKITKMLFCQKNVKKAYQGKKNN